MRGAPIIDSNNDEDEHLFKNAADYRDLGRDAKDFCAKVNLHNFNVHLHIEDFLDWLAEVERFFNYNDVS